MVSLGEATIEVGADADGFTRDVNGELRKAQSRFASEGDRAGRGFGLGFSRGFQRSSKDVGAGISSFGELEFSLSKVAAGFTGVTSSIVPLPSALGGVVAGAVAVAGAAAQASGAAVSLGGVMASLGLAQVTTQVASIGLSEAFEAQSKAQQELAATGKVSTATQEALDTALQGLAPSARNVVRAVSAITPAWSAMQNVVQQTFFQGIGRSIREVSEAVLPSVQRGLVATAGTVNGALQSFARFATSEQFVSSLDNILASLNGTLSALLPGLGQLGRGFLTVFEAGLGPSEGIARAFTEMATRFNDFIQSASDSGQLTTFFNDAVEVAGDLVGILGDVGGVLGTVLAAGAGPGAVLISMLHDATTALATFVQTAGAGAGLQDFFGLISTTGDTLRILAGALGPLFQGVFAVLGALIPQVTALQGVLQPVVTTLGTALGTALQGLAPALGAIIGIVVQLVGVLAPFVNLLVSVLGPAISKIGALFSQHLAPPLQDLITQLQPVFDLMYKSFGPQITGLINGLVTIIGGLFEVLGGLITFLVGVFTGDWKKAWSGIETIFSGLVNVILGLLEILVSRMGVNFDDIGSIVTDAWNSMVRFTTQAVVNILATVSRTLRGLPSVVRSAFLTAVNFLVTAFTNGVSRARQIAGNIVESIRGVLGRLNLFDAGRNILSSLAEGMINGLSRAFAVAQQAAQGIRDFFPFSPAKTGPMSGRGSPDIAGRTIMDMLSQGIRANEQAPDRALAAALRPLGDLASGRRTVADFTTGGSFAGVSSTRRSERVDRTIRPISRPLPRPIARPSIPGQGDSVTPFIPPVRIEQNYYGPTTSGGRAREIEWAVQYSVPSAVKNSQSAVFAR